MRKHIYLLAVDALLSNGDISYDINSKVVDAYLGNIAEDYGEEALIVAAGVCMKRYEKTKKLGRTCLYYKRIAEKHMEEISCNGKRDVHLGRS